MPNVFEHCFVHNIWAFIWTLATNILGFIKCFKLSSVVTLNECLLKNHWVGTCLTFDCRHFFSSVKYVCEAHRCSFTHLDPHFIDGAHAKYMLVLFECHCKAHEARIHSLWYFSINVSIVKFKWMENEMSANKTFQLSQKKKENTKRFQQKNLLKEMNIYASHIR